MNLPHNDHRAILLHCMERGRKLYHRVAPLSTRLQTLLHPVTRMIRPPDSPRLARSLYRHIYPDPLLHVHDKRGAFALRWRDSANPASCDPPRQSRRDRRTRTVRLLAVSGSILTAGAFLWGATAAPLVTSALFLTSSTLLMLAYAVRATIRDDPGLQNLDNEHRASCDPAGQPAREQVSGRIKRKAVND